MLYSRTRIKETFGYKKRFHSSDFMQVKLSTLLGQLIKKLWIKETLFSPPNEFLLSEFDCIHILVEKKMSRSSHLIHPLKDLASKFTPCKNLTRRCDPCEIFQENNFQGNNNKFFARKALLAKILQGSHLSNDQVSFKEFRENCIILQDLARFLEGKQILSTRVVNCIILDGWREIDGIKCFKNHSCG